jgi:hypothetical protein
MQRPPSFVFVMSKVSDVAKPVNRLPKLPGQCAAIELLDQFGAIYSIDDPLYRLGFYIGMLRPVWCRGCRGWLLVEVETEEDRT